MDAVRQTDEESKSTFYSSVNSVDTFPARENPFVVLRYFSTRHAHKGCPQRPLDCPHYCREGLAPPTCSYLFGILRLALLTQNDDCVILERSDRIFLGFYHFTALRSRMTSKRAMLTRVWGVLPPALRVVILLNRQEW